VVLSVPASRTSFWARPHIAAVLAPVPRAETARRPDSPHDQLQSILRNADDLSGPLRALGAQAAVAARQLLASIEQADREIAELARSLDAGEEERLAEKIEALGAARGDASSPMRQLLAKQLELVRELSARLQDAREERSRKLELLKTLTLHLTSLRARAAEAPGEVPSLSERVRALCDEIGGQALALADARAAAGQGTRDTPTHVPQRGKTDS
jgi:chromosome segregation ATPase